MPQESANSKRPRGSADPSEPVAALQPTPSVKVRILDEQHERCEAALTSLAAQRDVASLRALLREYEEHFAAEEAMLDEHLYAGVVDGTAAGGGFSTDKSMRTSHFADHKRMIADLQAAERSLPECAMLPMALVDGVLRDFEQHASRYDGAYADRLSASLAAAQ